MEHEHNITYADREIVVLGTYHSGDCGEWTNSAGEWGTEDSAPEFYIDKILDLNGIDITSQYTAEDFSKISEKILEGYE